MSRWYARHEDTGEVLESGPWPTLEQGWTALGVLFDTDEPWCLSYELWDEDSPAAIAKRNLLAADATTLRSLKSVVDEAEEVTERAQSIESTARHQLRLAVAKVIGIDVWDVEIGGYACKDSPINLCIYNTKEDHCCDFCVICGDPDERK